MDSLLVGQPIRSVQQEEQLGGVPVARVNNNPIQKPGQHEIVREITLGGPEVRQDRRMYLHTKELEKLLEVAKSSLTSRAQIDLVGVKVSLRRTPRGEHYEVWTLLGLRPKAEENAMASALSGVTLE